MADLRAQAHQPPVALGDGGIIDQDMNAGVGLSGDLPDMIDQTASEDDAGFMTADMPAMADMPFDPETL